MGVGSSTVLVLADAVAIPEGVGVAEGMAVAVDALPN
jgi:hypothetical protein